MSSLGIPLGHRIDREFVCMDWKMVHLEREEKVLIDAHALVYVSMALSPALGGNTTLKKLAITHCERM